MARYGDAETWRDWNSKGKHSANVMETTPEEKTRKALTNFYAKMAGERKTRNKVTEQAIRPAEEGPMMHEQVGGSCNFTSIMVFLKAYFEKYSNERDYFIFRAALADKGLAAAKVGQKKDEVHESVLLNRIHDRRIGLLNAQVEKYENLLRE